MSDELFWYASESTFTDVEEILENNLDVDVTLDKHKSIAYLEGEAMYGYEEEYQQRLPDSTFYIPVKGYLYGSYYNHITRKIYEGQGAKLIFMDFDTLGGEASGLQSITALMRDSKVKIIGYTSGHCCSAGYFLAANCTKFYSSQDARIGSIGSIGSFRKKASYDNEYMGTTVSRRAPKKLSNQADSQKLSNDYEEIFYDEVALGRNVSHEFIEKNFGQGGTVLGDEAFGSKMTDGVEHRHSLFERMGILPPLTNQASEENDEPFFNELNSNAGDQTMAENQNGASSDAGDANNSGQGQQQSAAPATPPQPQTAEQIHNTAMQAVYSRIGTVKASGEYAGREKLADRLIASTMSTEDVIATLQDAPRENQQVAPPQGQGHTGQAPVQGQGNQNAAGAQTIANGQNPLDALYNREGGGPNVGAGEDSTQSAIENYQQQNGGFAPPQGQQNSQSGVGNNGQDSLLNDPLYAMLDLNPHLTDEEKRHMVMDCRANEREHGIPSDSLAGSLDDRTDLLNIGNG